MNKRQKKLLTISRVQFAAWELHLYLNTHPNDKNAAMRYKELEAEYQRLLAEYEQEYGAIILPAEGNSWLSGPWPWENTKEVN